MTTATDPKLAAAVRDYQTSGDTYKTVAERHGISTTRLHNAINPLPPRRRIADDTDYGYQGAHDFDPTMWEARGGILHPLFPETRTK